MKEVTILNLSDVYKRQDFYSKIPYQWIDFTDLSGIHGFCGGEAMETMEQRTREVKDGIRFLDSGNFHYLSYILQKRIKQPFTLVVLDHHTDMMASMFEELLSCGCWIKRALDEADFLRSVVLIGVADELEETLEEEYKDRVTVYFKSQLSDRDWLSDFKSRLFHPVYLSVDKDVFSSSETVTDWDQGSMVFEQFQSIWQVLKETVPIISVDICGEYDSTRDGAVTDIPPDQLNSQFNERLLKLLQEW